MPFQSLTQILSFCYLKHLVIQTKKMNLVELINYFRSEGNQTEFFKNNSLDTESEVIEIYMQKPFSIENTIKLFEVEKTEGEIEFDFNDSKYFNLIDFYYFFDFIEESKSKKNKSMSDSELAKVLLDYCVNDA